MRILYFIFLVLSLVAQTTFATSPENPVYRSWIEAMKLAPRGPFDRIRWFCNDGQVLPPEPYACVEFGGGTQHGEWTEKTQELREHGFLVASLLADISEDDDSFPVDNSDRLNQLLLENFLFNIDDGWILRHARYYRGSIQSEAEARGGRRLLISLLKKKEWQTQGFLPIRLAVAMLPHGVETQSVINIRQQSSDLSQRDPGFVELRNKIHGHPEASDALLVREYVASLDSDELKEDLLALAQLIEDVYQPRDLSQDLQKLGSRKSVPSALARQFSDAANTWKQDPSVFIRFQLSADLMAAIREYLPRFGGSVYRMLALDLSILLEKEHYIAATELHKQLKTRERQQLLQYVTSSLKAMYGAGLISKRQLKAIESEIGLLSVNEMSVGSYKKVLDYLALAPGWGSQRMRFHFYESMQKFSHIEPLSMLFIQDQLRGSPLFFYADLLNVLLRDANKLAGVRKKLLGDDVGGGLRALNPGLARGTLYLHQDDSLESFDRQGIYLLPETVSELPPVGGILTAGSGNPLSHVQLLARNLGIPNVGVDESLLPRIQESVGKSVLLAVSRAGSVEIIEDDQSLITAEQSATDIVIRPDLEKLDLENTAFQPLSELRANDSGRTVGPKAAKLGELYHHYPDAVANGLTIPFGIFRQLLEQPYSDDETVLEWMQRNYRRIESMPVGSPEHQQATEVLREAIYNWVLNADPGEEFRNSLKLAMEPVFGDDGSYGVFVRSDTNVEDLSGFTGAGLNLTVPNVVGFQNIVSAISRVWASPFTARAFAWRQSRMQGPEHVYPAVLLMRSVPAEKSGVLVTRDIDTGSGDWLSVAVNEGVGGAVDGQAAESLRINTKTSEVRLLAQATAPIRRIVSLQGGVEKRPVSDADHVLTEHDISLLIQLSKELPSRFPAITNDQGEPAPADIEFGFLNGKLMLFQIRPFLDSKQAQGSEYLLSLDAGLEKQAEQLVRLDERPQE